MSWEAIARFSSAIIAFCALGPTIWQARVMRHHNKLSVTPHLTTWSHSDKTSSRYVVELLNNGIGPALMSSFQIQVDGQSIIGEGAEPIEKALKILLPQYQYASYLSYVSKGYMMDAKESRSLVIETPLHTDHQLDQLVGQFERWRQTRSHRGERIPQALWDQAVALARGLPHTRVA